MAVAYGTRQSTLSSHTISNTDYMIPGKIYHTVWKAEGVQTYVGWEDSAIARLNESLYNQGCEPTYVSIDNQTNTITFQYRIKEQFQEYGEATAMVTPVVYLVAYAVAYIAIAAAIVIAVWLLSLTIVGGVKELSSSVSDTITDNPLMIPVVYGGLAIVGIVALIYLKDRFSSSSSKSSG